MKEELKGWFDCLNGVAIELESVSSLIKHDLLFNTMKSACITLEEVRWAQGQNYSSIKDELISYEGELMYQEELEE